MVSPPVRLREFKKTANFSSAKSYGKKKTSFDNLCLRPSGKDGLIYHEPRRIESHCWKVNVASDYLLAVYPALCYICLHFPLVSFVSFYDSWLAQGFSWFSAFSATSSKSRSFIAKSPKQSSKPWMAIKLILPGISWVWQEALEKFSCTLYIHHCYEGNKVK